MIKLASGRVVVSLAVFLIALGIAFTSQHFRGSYSSELISDATEHYVTTLMVRDYIATALPANPLRFAQEYFIHYPMIRIGNNPPGFYALSGPWMFFTSDTIRSALILSAILAAIYCAFVAVWLSRLEGLGAGILCGVFVALLPTIQRVAGSFLIDIPIGIFGVAAAMSYAKFMQRPDWKRAVLFSLLAVAGLWIKASAIYLGFMVPVAVVITGKFSLLRKWEFWLPSIFVCLLSLPWYLFTLQTLTAGAKTQWTITYPFLALSRYTEIFVANFTFVGFAVGVIGLFDRLYFIRKQEGTYEADQWAVVIALVFSVVFFQILVPANILERYMTSALGPFLMLLWPGAIRIGKWIVSLLGAGSRLTEKVQMRIPDAVLAAALALVLIGAANVGAQPANQMRMVAQQVIDRLPPNNPVILVGADGTRETSFIAELAQLDRKRPGMIAVRGARLLGDKSSFMNIDYKPRFATAGEVLGELERLGIPMILVDRGAKAQLWEHNKMLASLTDNQPELWQKLWSMDNPDNDGTVSLYLLKSAAEKRADMPLLRQEFRPNR